MMSLSTKLKCYMGLMGLALVSSSVMAESQVVEYKNQRGSVLSIQYSDNNSITGSFTTAVATKDCREAIGVKRPVIGYMAKNAISFSVNYPECGSVVAFAGNVEQNKSIIATTALIVHHSKDTAKNNASFAMISHDVFKKIS